MKQKETKAKKNNNILAPVTHTYVHTYKHAHKIEGLKKFFKNQKTNSYFMTNVVFVLIYGDETNNRTNY